ncbi:hypothetical protein [Arthrobacter sp.]|uniref:hypothetical protein n=1 Tax=Arthrobacter sp. TaxID=1667 RepID=UPI003A9593D1
MLAAVLATLGLIIGAAAVWLALRLHWRSLVAHRVVVNLKSGQSLDGFLVRQSGPLLFVRDASFLQPGSEPVAMDGEIVVERSEVEFIQAP